ncbi:uncharacterized protein METZ01_LOCUS382519, partial [marine metagenome]
MCTTNPDEHLDPMMSTAQKCKTDTCCSPEQQCPPKKKHPRIKTTGTAVRDFEPTDVEHTVTISAEGEDRRDAMDGFQKQLKAFTECLDSETKHTLSPLRETSETVGEGRHEVNRTVISATATIHLRFSTFAGLFVALIEAGFWVSNPKFTFDQVTEPDSDLFREAATAARQNAEATAQGAGFSLGNVVSVDFGEEAPKTRKSDLWSAPSTAKSMLNLNLSFPSIFGSRWEPEKEPVEPLDYRVFEMLNTEVP